MHLLACRWTQLPAGIAAKDLWLCSLAYPATNKYHFLKLLYENVNKIFIVYKFSIVPCSFLTQVVDVRFTTDDGNVRLGLQKGVKRKVRAQENNN